MKLHWLLYSTILMRPEDGAGAAVTTTADPAAGGAAATGATTGATTGAAATTDAAAATTTTTAAAPYRPDGLPDHLYGKSDKETIDALSTAYKGARDAMATRGEVPKDAAGYVFEPPEAVKPFADGLAKDPFFDKVKGIALKHGLPAPMFNGFLGDIMSEMVAGDMVMKPFSVDDELAALLPNVTDPEQRKLQGSKMSADTLALLDVWAEKGAPADAIEFMKLNADRAVAIKLVTWLGGQGGDGMKPALGGSGGSAILSESDLNARIQDPRNQFDSPKYDPAFAEETFRLGQARKAATARA